MTTDRAQFIACRGNFLIQNDIVVIVIINEYSGQLTSESRSEFSFILSLHEPQKDKETLQDTAVSKQKSSVWPPPTPTIIGSPPPSVAWPLLFDGPPLYPHINSTSEVNLLFPRNRGEINLQVLPFFFFVWPQQVKTPHAGKKFPPQQVHEGRQHSYISFIFKHASELAQRGFSFIPSYFLWSHSFEYQEKKRFFIPECKNVVNLEKKLFSPILLIYFSFTCRLVFSGQET